jgi:hypothetical protein
MTCLGEIRSPLEASVQELCNARLVEVMCTWTKASLQFPPANFICGLPLSGPRQILIPRPWSWRSQPNSPPSGGKFAPDKLNLAVTNPLTDLSPSTTGTRRKSAKDFSSRYAPWGSQDSNNSPSWQSLPSEAQSREDTRFPIPAAVLHALVCMWSNGIA